MNVPGISFAVPIPVARMDRPPAGDETKIFTYAPASEWEEHWVAIDVPRARAVARNLVEAFEAVRGPSVLELLE